MIYGKMKMELRYFLHFRLVRVTRKATTPPKKIAITEAEIETTSVFSSG